MELRQLRAFQNVAKLLSFNRAAEQLHYAQSSISAQVQALEQELGVQLFDRLGKRVLVTEAGKRLLEYAQKILDLAEEGRAEATGVREPQGSLTIRIPESLGVRRFPPVIKAFHERYPKVQLRFTTCAHDGLQEDLRKGITDLAFLLTESVQASDLMVEVLGFEPLVLVAAPDHALARKRHVSTSEISGPILLTRVDCSYRKTFERIIEEEGSSHGEVLELNSVELVKQCVMAGVGITILPKSSIREEVAKKRLAFLKWEEGEIEVAILMVWYKERWLSPSLSAFMDITRTILKKAAA